MTEHATSSTSRHFALREQALCRICGGDFTRNDPPWHFGRVTVEGSITTDVYIGVAHRMCVAPAVWSDNPIEHLDRCTKEDCPRVSEDQQ